MKITFLGSSHGVPEPNRKCSCIMLEAGENVYFIDMGTPAIDQLVRRGISIDRVKGVFITHMHGDHTNGLIQFVDLITWYYKTPDPVICLPIPEAKNVINSWLEVTLNGHTKELEYRETRPGIVFDDGVIRVTAIATRHCLKSYSYLVECEGKSVLFTGDLRRPGEDFPEIARKMHIDLAVCESAHFPATEYLDVFEQCNIVRVCITHYVNRFFENVLTIQRTLMEKGIPVEIATDDRELTV